MLGQISERTGEVGPYIHEISRLKSSYNRLSHEFSFLKHLNVNILSSVMQYLIDSSVSYLTSFLLDLISTLFNALITVNLNTNCFDNLVINHSFFTLFPQFLPSNSPAHHKQFSDTWIDLYISNSPTKILSSSKFPVPFLLLHDLIQNSYCVCVKSSTFVAVWTTFLTDPSNLTLIDAVASTLTSSLLSIFDMHAPLKS